AASGVCAGADRDAEVINTIEATATAAGRTRRRTGYRLTDMARSSSIVASRQQARAIARPLKACRPCARYGPESRPALCARGLRYLAGQFRRLLQPAPGLGRPACADRVEFAQEDAPQQRDSGVRSAEQLLAAIDARSLPDGGDIVLRAGELDEL